MVLSAYGPGHPQRGGWEGSLSWLRRRSCNGQDELQTQADLTLELQRSENQVALLKLPELPIVQHPITDAKQNKVVICAELGELGSKQT